MEGVSALTVLVSWVTGWLFVGWCVILGMLALMIFAEKR